MLIALCLILHGRRRKGKRSPDFKYVTSTQMCIYKNYSTNVRTPENVYCYHLFFFYFFSSLLIYFNVVTRGLLNINDMLYILLSHRHWQFLHTSLCLLFLLLTLFRIICWLEPLLFFIYYRNPNTLAWWNCFLIFGSLNFLLQWKGWFVTGFVLFHFVYVRSKLLS